MQSINSYEEKQKILNLISEILNVDMVMIDIDGSKVAATGRYEHISKNQKYNDFEPHHAFIIGDNVWGVQFHPEFNAGVMKEYIREMRGPCVSEENNPESIFSSVKEHEFGTMLMRRFVEIAGEYS